MRQLGDASIQSYRYDLVYLHASLLADENERVTALAPSVAAMVDELRVERDLYERAEEAEIVASAVRVRRDTKLDRTIIGFGGVARAIAENVYRIFFGRLSPSRIAKSGLDEQIREVKTLLGQFTNLPEDDPLRVAHEPAITQALADLEAAKAAEEQADVALTVAKTRLVTFKARLDRQRVEIYGKLVDILGDKSLADTYFRQTRSTPKGGDLPPPPPGGGDDPDPGAP